jgi:hypothetical protein
MQDGVHLAPLDNPSITALIGTVRRSVACMMQCNALLRWGQARKPAPVFATSFNLTLHVAPAQIGDNEWAVDVTDKRPGALSAPAKVLLRFDMLGMQMGKLQIDTTTTDKQRYTTRGSYTSLASTKTPVRDQPPSRSQPRRQRRRPQRRAQPTRPLPLQANQRVRRVRRAYPRLAITPQIRQAIS